MSRAHGFSNDEIRGFGIQEIGRAGRTFAILARHALAFAWRASFQRSGVSRSEIAARELKLAFAELGPTYVKLAQLIASSPGLFPEVLADEFRSLLDEVPPVPAEHVATVLLEELGVSPDQAFASFDTIPLASASIAQVHAARLHDGEDVVVKVQRPGIRLRLERDLRILMVAARLLDRFSSAGRMANPVAVVEDFAATLSEELNFVNEARSMEAFEVNLRRYGQNDGVRVPSVRWRCTTPRVLTMERIHGYKIDDLVPRQATFARLMTSCSLMSRAWRLRQAM